MPADDGTEPEPIPPGQAAAAAAASSEAAPHPLDEEISGRVPLDLVGGLFLLFVAAVFILNAGDDMLDWIFPLSLAYTVGAIGLYLVTRGLLGLGEKTDTLVPVFKGRGVDVFVISSLVTVYVVLARPVGFWIMSMVMLFGGSVYLDNERTAKRMVSAAVVAFVVCIVAYLLLRKVFYIPLPKARWLPF